MKELEAKKEIKGTLYVIRSVSESLCRVLREAFTASLFSSASSEWTAVTSQWRAAFRRQTTSFSLRSSTLSLSEIKPPARLSVPNKNLRSASVAFSSQSRRSRLNEPHSRHTEKQPVLWVYLLLSYFSFCSGAAAAPAGLSADPFRLSKLPLPIPNKRVKTWHILNISWEPKTQVTWESWHQTCAHWSDNNLVSVFYDLKPPAECLAWLWARGGRSC